MAPGIVPGAILRGGNRYGTATPNVSHLLMSPVE